MNTDESMIQRYVLKPAVVGGVAYAGNSMLNLVDGKTINVGGKKYPLPVVAAVAVGVGSMLSEVSHDYLLPHIHWLDKVNSPASLALASGVTGTGNVVA